MKTLALSALILAAPSWWGGPWTPPGHMKTEVCHYDADLDEYKTLLLPPHAAAKHAAKHVNDYMGACAPEPEPTSTPAEPTT